jgi:hypothetical protein
MLSHDPDADPENIGLGAVFRKYGEAMRTRRDEHDAMREAAEDFPQRYTDALRDADRTEFIHLREARVYGAGANPLPGNGMLWRGRLSDVAGWSFGLLGATPA